MKTYKIVILNEEFRLSRKKDAADAEAKLNEYISQGWILEQIVTPNDGLGSLVAILYKE